MNLSLAVGAPFCAALLSAIEMSAASSQGSADVIEALRKKHDLPALAAVVVKDGRICDRAAAGVRKLGDPTRVTTNDLFHIGSCTKSMTATLAAILIEEGKLRWDTTVGEAFPEWKGTMNSNYVPVTLEQLLTHRGGCPAEAPTKAVGRTLLETGPVMQQRAVFVQTVLAAKPEVAPGTKYLYSNQGYTVAGAMLEKITGKAWEELITEKVFQPLGMKSAGFGAPGTPGQVDQPWGHARVLWRPTPLQKDNPAAIGPAGRVHCSLDDLARYVMAHPERGSGGKALLKPETFRKLHTPPEGQEYACGWVNLERDWAKGRALMHNGSNTLWYLVMWLAPERNFAVIVATNIGGDKAESGCDE